MTVNLQLNQKQLIICHQPPKKKNVVEYDSCVSSENDSVYENEESAK